MEIFQDFKDLLELLNAHKVEYIVVGGYALAHHGAPRYTGDIDIWIKPDKSNAERVLKTLADFDVPISQFSVDDFTKSDNIIQLGYPPVRVDIITSATGVDWQEAWNNRSVGNYDGVPTPFIGKKELKKNKESTGRPKDIFDIAILGKTDN